MKKILTVLILTSMVFLSTCSSKGPEKPSDCALDFWIAENVENIDFSEYEEIYGWFGAREFLGKGYHTVINEDGESVKPDHYVSYVITAYPDYSSGGQYVTEIVITDPNVQMYGLFVTSSIEEFDSLFENMGYHIEEVGNTGMYHKAVKEKIAFTYGGGIVRITAEVTNRFGIQY